MKESRNPHAAYTNRCVILGGRDVDLILIYNFNIFPSFEEKIIQGLKIEKGFSIMHFQEPHKRYSKNHSLNPQTVWLNKHGEYEILNGK